MKEGTILPFLFYKERGSGFKENVYNNRNTQEDNYIRKVHNSPIDVVIFLWRLPCGSGEQEHAGKPCQQCKIYI